jgi:TIR domain
MAFVRGFTHDVFISYAHANNEPLFPGWRGWTTHLFQDLPARLRLHLGRAPDLDIFMDEKLRGNDEVNESLLEKIRESAIMIVVLTQGYLDSTWCLDELRTFTGQSHPRSGLYVGDRSRLFKVMPRDIPLEHHPPPLDNATGYRFFSVDGATTRTFRRTEEADSDQRHWDKLEDLAKDLAGLLTGLNDQPEPLRVKPDPPPSQPAVFVAEVADDLDGERDQLVRELGQRGIVVLPQRDLPPKLAELETTVKGYLARSVLSIHMLGRYYGKKVDGDTRSRPHVQIDLAKGADGQRPVPSLVWVPRDVESERLSDERQRALLERIENDPDRHARAELLRIGLEELKQIVVRRVLPPPAGRQAQSLVYITCVTQDRPEALTVKEFFRQRGYGVVLQLHGREEQTWTHERYVRICDVLVIVYGRADVGWVQERAAEALEQARLATGRRRPLAAGAIYHAPPPDKDDVGIDAEDLLVVDCRDGFSETVFTGFLDRLTERLQALTP